MSTTTPKRPHRRVSAQAAAEAARARKELREAARKTLWENPDDPRHGKVGTYTYWGCRCDRCAEANRVALVRWRATGSTK